MTDMHIGKWVFLLGAAFYLLSTSGERYTGDGDLVVLVAESMVDRGSVCIQGGRAANTYVLEDGCKVSDYSLGTSLILVPDIVLIRGMEALGLRSGHLYIMMKNILHYLMPSVIGGLTWLLFFLLATWLSGNRRKAFWLTVVFGTTTTVWYYSRTVFSEGLQTFSLLACVTALYSYRNHGERKSALLMGALAFGLCVTTKASNWLLLPLIAGYLAWGKWRKSTRELLIFGAALFPFLVLQLWFNYFRFGNILDFGYHWGRDQELGFSNSLFFGIWGYLFSPSKSFFLYSPIAFLALWGWKRFFKKNLPEALLFIGIAVVVVCQYGSWWAWHGDWSWGPRFLNVLVPFMALPAVFLFSEGLKKRRILTGVLIALAAVGFWVQFLGCFVPTWKYQGIALQSTLASFPKYGQRLGNNAHKPVDTQIPVHYLPQFSPILGHWWLLKHYVTQDPNLSDDNPWKSMQIEAWQPREVGVNYGLDWWGNTKLAQPKDYPWYSIAFAIFFMLGMTGLMVFAFLRLRRLMPGHFQ